MAFDMGFNFRSNSGFVTDQAYAVAVTDSAGHTYPHTYTNVNGDSINAGWQVLPGGSADTVNTNDPRLAGACYITGASRTFQIDLSSGSAPGAGSYDLDIALGYTGATRPAENALVKDNTTTVLDLTNGGAGYSTADGQFVSATGALVTASTTWTGTKVNKTFATTTVLVVLNSIADGNNEMIAHFRLTLAIVAAPIPRITMPPMRAA